MGGSLSFPGKQQVPVEGGASGPRYVKLFNKYLLTYLVFALLIFHIG